MRKYLAATALGALLVAGQVAAQDGAVVSLGDRIGAAGSASDSLVDCHHDNNDLNDCCHLDQNGGSRDSCVARDIWIVLASALFIGLIAWGISQSGNGTPATP